MSTLVPNIPTYPTVRLVGIELEIDTARQTLTLPSDTPGWAINRDGSLSSNGRELVLDPPRSLPDAVPLIRNICKQLIDINVHKTGSLHVHVQAHDYNHDDAHDLVKLYTHFQPVINRLVGQSRVGCRYCPPYPRGLRKDELISKFQLNSPAHDRNGARSSRVYSVINLAMLRCHTPSHRTIEFRQGSVSKRAICVAGWATLMVALVDIAKVDKELIQSLESGLVPPRMRARAADSQFKLLMEKFLELLLAHEARSGAHGLKDWVMWRHEYLYGRPTMANARKLADALIGGPKGLFGISRLLDTNISYAQRLIDFALQRGLISRHPHKPIYMVAYDSCSAADLAYLERMARCEGTPLGEIVEDTESAIDAVLNPSQVPVPSGPVPATS